jgi:FkbM family methyltransferase
MSRIKSFARHVLNKSVNRQRFNDSALYALYLAARYPAYASSKKTEAEFYRQALGNCPNIVFDVGASGGDKTAIFARFANRVVSIEPSPAAVALLQQRFAHNPKVTIVAKGVGDSEQTAQFNVFGATDAYNTFSPKWAVTLSRSDGKANRPSKVITSVMDIPMTTLDQLINAHGSPNYIKIDVEGYELPVIKGLSKPVPLISFECNLPEFKDETKEIIGLLSDRSPKAVYNFTTSEPPRAFASPSWLDSDEMSVIVDRGEYQFLEIFSRTVR